MKNILKFKEKLYIKLIESNFKSFLILTYPLEVYPEKEENIKTHLLSFTEFMRKIIKTSNKTYFYTYNLQENNIHINILCSISETNLLFKLKKKWCIIIGSSNEQSLEFEKINNSEFYCHYLLKTLGDKAIETILLKKLGKSSRLFGGSKEFQNVLKEVRQNNIEIPINFMELKGEKSLTEIVLEIKKEYPNITSDLIDQELTLELKNYSEVYTKIKYLDLEEFLKKGKSKISKGYLKFYNFIKELSNESIFEFEELIINWYETKERKHYLVELIIESLNLKNKDINGDRKFILIACLDLIIKASIRNIRLIDISLSIGKIILKNIDNIKNNIEDKDYRKVGSIIILTIQKLLKTRFNFYLIEDQIIEDKFNDELDYIIDETTSSFNNSRAILDFSLNETWYQSLKLDRKITKEEITKYLLLVSPLLVEPKDWVIEKGLAPELTKTDMQLFDASKIVNGGYLLNSYYFKKVLQKNINHSNAHKLAISKDCINTINKIQKISYEVNTDHLLLLNKYKYLFKDNLSKIDIKNLNYLKGQKTKLMKELFKQKLKYTSEGLNILPITQQLNDLRLEIEEIVSKISKHTLFHRILMGFDEIKDFEKFYYSYDLDFRMRLYPQQMELSPQGSKLARSLIKFKEKYEFNLEEFIMYSTRLYVKIYNFQEHDLLTIFRVKIQPLLEEFIINEEEAIKTILTADISEPYLFLAACIEYKNYKLAERKGEKYYTGYPIIMDCSGSGPQILSLLFLMEDFSKYLNLEPNIERKDFYISIINKFLEEDNWSVNLSKEEFNKNKNELLIILRGICKSSIMTQIYGISYRKFSQDLERGFKKNKEKLEQYFIKSVEYSFIIENFIKSFWAFQRQLSLYKLREFFEKIVKNLKKEDMDLSWTVLDKSKINVNYKMFKEKNLDFKENILGRLRMQFYEPINMKNYSKIRTSAQANFIHSIDAYINMSIIEKFNKPIFTIHDAWGVPMGSSETLKQLIRDIYFKISDKNLVFQQLIFDFVTLLSDTVSKEAGESFKKYCEEKILIGTYDPNSILLCKYMIYFG